MKLQQRHQLGNTDLRIISFPKKKKKLLETLPSDLSEENLRLGITGLRWTDEPLLFSNVLGSEERKNKSKHLLKRTNRLDNRSQLANEQANV